MSPPPGIAIYDLAPRGYLAFDLVDLLELFGSDIETSNWICADVECTGEGSADLEAAADAGRRISTKELRGFAGRVQQTIWGTFDAFRDADATPWLRVRAIDSSYFVVFSTNDTLLQRARARFHTVRPAVPLDWDIEP
jgi:hypothetical protein